MGSLARKFQEEARAEVRAEEKRETARIMLAEGSDINFISKVTKLTVEEVNRIKDEKPEE